MTKRQLALLKFIKSFIDENGYSPSYDNMKDELGLKSKSNIHRLVRALRDYGEITFHKGRANSIQITSRDVSLVKIKEAVADYEVGAIGPRDVLEAIKMVLYP